MNKNIVLCSDGTGNAGGEGPSSNVFAIYHAIQTRNPTRPQICFYDNGVGTHKNRYLRAMGGAFGFGFEKNVCDLYEFLARNYEEGDGIFVFGFSRGAATVRAFAGMVETCGLVRPGDMPEDEFQTALQEALQAYRLGDGALLEIFNPVQPTLTMLGIWDTVSALGFPRDWGQAFNGLFKRVEKLADWLWPHSFYNYAPNHSVENVYHALSVDDERRTFKPRIWNEHDFAGGGDIEQVWFPGVHSNVGGGYPRSELSCLALEWMMVRAERLGLEFEPTAFSQVKDRASAHGKIYDSREGVAVYFRYHPRDIKALCSGKMSTGIQIHRSVFDRMKRFTGGYAPRVLPGDFAITDTDPDQPSQQVSPRLEPAWRATQSRLARLIRQRERIYAIFLESTVALLVVSGYFWLNPPACYIEQPCCGSDSCLGWLASHIEDVLHYVLPVYFEPFVTWLLTHPLVSLLLVAMTILLYRQRTGVRKAVVREASALRIGTLQAIVPAAINPSPADDN